MRSVRDRAFVSAALVGLVIAGASAVSRAQQSPAAVPAAAPEPAPAATPAAPRAGRPQTPALGDGPWDFATQTGRIQVTVVTKGLDHPWGMAFLPDGDLLVTERAGRLRIVRDGALDPTPIAGMPAVRAAVIGGLADVVLHPNFRRNQLIYFSYSKPDAQDPSVSTLAVARARFDGGAALVDVEDIFVAADWYGSTMAGKNNRCCGQGPADGSFGARMAFGRDGMLYVASGDRNWGEKAQEPSSHLGKIVRIRDDGKVPRDNPFVGEDGYRPEIYTLGHRNPTGLTVHPTTGELWSTEFGPRGGDELNRIEAGKNYGWILVTHGAHYNGDPVVSGVENVPGMVDPVAVLGAVDQSRQPELLHGRQARGLARRSVARHDVAIARAHQLRRRRQADGEERLLTALGQRLRDVRQGPDGFVYVLTDETAGALLKIEP